MPEAKLVSITPNYKELLLLACSKPYGKDVSLKGLKHIIEAGHLSQVFCESLRTAHETQTSFFYLPKCKRKRV